MQKRLKNNGEDLIKKLKKKFNIITTVIIGVVFVLVLFALFSIIMQSVGGKTPSMFGYRFYYILTDSMTPELQVNDVIISEVLGKNLTYKDIKVGDVVTYEVEYGELAGMTITHKVIETAHFDTNINRLVITTQGTKTGARIDEPVPVENIEAVMVKKADGVSKLYRFIRTPFGVCIMLILPMVLLLATLIFRLVKEVLKPINNQIKEQKEIINKNKNDTKQ